MSFTTRHGRFAIHTLATLGLGLSLASSIVATTIVPSTASAANTPIVPEDGLITFDNAEQAYAHFKNAVLSYHNYLKRLSASEYVGPEWMLGTARYNNENAQHLVDMVEARGWAEIIKRVSELAMFNTGSAWEGLEPERMEKSGRSKVVQIAREAGTKSANLIHSISVSIFNSLSKFAGVLWIDPTVLAPDYYSQVPQNEYGAIASGDGYGYGNALIIELTPGGGGYGYDYSTEDGYGYDGGGGGDYYSEESYDSGATASGTPSTTPEPSTADDAGSCPTTDGEYSFDSIEEACSCPAVDYWYETETGEDGETTTTDSGMCSDIPSDAQSCVPNWRDWYNVLETESGSRVAVPDMIYAIPSDSVRSEFFAALPVILSSMVDGDTLNLHYSESWLIGDSGLALSAPISSSMMLQTNAIDVADQELGIDAVLVSYTCSASPRALGGTMAPGLLDGDMSLIDADGVITDGSAVQAAIIDVMQ